jgi:AcrR family transcriptional regulator
MGDVVIISPGEEVCEPLRYEGSFSRTIRILHNSPPDELKRRKTPRQARAEATLDAIREATIQVLLAEGERRLTTTRVAERAGVSVGTMYQYFPHKQALLHAVLQWHLAHISGAVEAACQGCRGRPAAEMPDGLVDAFLDAKTERLDVTKALYPIVKDLDSTTLLATATDRNVATTAALLATAADADFENLPAVAFIMFAGIAGSTRIVFERGASLFKSYAASCRSCADLICLHLDEPGRARKMEHWLLPQLPGKCPVLSRTASALIDRVGEGYRIPTCTIPSASTWSASDIRPRTNPLRGRGA